MIVKSVIILTETNLETHILQDSIQKVLATMENQESPPLNKQQSCTARMNRINSIKSSLMSIPIISKNKTMIEKKILEHGYQNHEPLNDQKTFSNSSTHVQATFDHFQIFQLKYEMKQKIGEGSDGVVHKCIKKKTKKEYAVKSFMFEEERLLEIKNNFIILKTLKHKNILGHEALYIDIQKHICWIVMELIDGKKLSKIQLEDQDQIRQILQQIIDSLQFLHQRAISHRDVKPENILYNPETKEVKLIDFGICRRHRRRGVNFNMLTITGTLYYRAPQMFVGGGYNEKVDIWSTGILLYRIIAGHTPFQSQYLSQTIQNIMNSQLTFGAKFEKYSHSLQSLLLRMLKKNPQERLNAAECLRDSWFYAIPLTQNLRKGSYNKQYQKDFVIPSPIIQGLCNDLISVKKINGDEFQCIDSDEEVPKFIHLKKRRSSVKDQLSNFTLK